MNKELIVKQLREMAKHPTVTLPRDCEILKAAADLIEQAQKQDHTYGYAKGLAETIFKQHFANDEHYASGRIVWGVNDTVIGILTQIDNMVADMVRKSEQAQKQEPVGYVAQLIEALYENGDPVSVDAAEYLEKHPSPPQRQPLKDEQMFKIWLTVPAETEDRFAFARAIEAAHGIKAEREACALICEEPWQGSPRGIAEQIRARGKHEHRSNEAGA